MANILFIKIADIIIKIESDINLRRFRDFNFYKDFIITNAPFYHCILKHKIVKFIPNFILDKPFYTQNWKLAKSEDKIVLFIGPTPKRAKPDNVVVFNHNYKEGVIYQKSVFELFRRFIDQFLIINLLSQNNGFLLHSSGIVLKDKGICFAGRSGAGKSTLLNLFKDEVNKNYLLNDDRCALRRHGNKWYLSGTPWYGKLHLSSPVSKELSAIFFIYHSQQNYIRKLSSNEIFSKLVALSMLPLWEKKATLQVLTTFQNFIQNVSAFEFGFVPNKSAIEVIKKTI